MYLPIVWRAHQGKTIPHDAGSIFEEPQVFQMLDFQQNLQLSVWLGEDTPAHFLVSVATCGRGDDKRCV